MADFASGFSTSGLANPDRNHHQQDNDMNEEPNPFTSAIVGAHRDMKEADDDDADYQDNSESYTWDLCMIFDLGRTNHRFEREGRNVIEHDWFTQMAAETVKALKHAGLKVLLYRGQNRNQVFCLIAASEERLRTEADRCAWDLELDGPLTREYGLLMKERLATATQKYVDDPIYQRFTPEIFENVYCPFQSSLEREHPHRFALFKQHTNDEGKYHERTLFRHHDRLKLTASIISAEIGEGGAGLLIGKAIASSHHPLDGFYPLHQENQLKLLETEWLRFGALWAQPLERIRTYFGEHVALYFCFIQFYSRWLIVPALFGAVLFIIQLATGEVDVKYATPAFGAFIALWCTTLLEFWRRAESRHMTHWGQTNYLAKETRRAGFVGTWTPSRVDARMQEEFPWAKKMCRQIVTHNIIVTMLVCVIACVVGIFLFRASLMTWSEQWGGYLAAIVSSLQIQILNAVYTHVARWLTQWENHRTESEHTNALIFKTFLFKFVNSYNSLIYIAFIKSSYEGCLNGDCLAELQKQLGTIFITTLTVNNIIEFAMPVFKKWSNKRSNLKTANTGSLSAAERESEMVTYESTFQDFDQTVIIYGYATLFVVAFPLAPLLALLSNMLSIRFDAMRICRYSRRPLPVGGQNIGEWFAILNVMGLISVITNGALVVFTSPSSDEFLSPDTHKRWLIFFCAEHVLLVIKAAIFYFVPDIAAGVKDHIERQEYINRVYFEGLPQPDEFVGKRKKQAVSPHSNVSRYYNLSSMPTELPNDPHLFERETVSVTYEPPVAVGARGISSSSPAMDGIRLESKSTGQYQSMT